MLGIFKELLYKIKKIQTAFKTRKKFKKGILPLNSYKNYDDYINHQKEKTTNPEKINKWLNEEWDIKVSGFKKIYSRNWEYIKDKKKAICLGARTGQEVKALLDLGVEAVGIDIVPFKPFTIKGDIHNIPFPDNAFDLAFTNVFDHALYPDKFCSEIERIIKDRGIIIFHLVIGEDIDEYSETIVYKPQRIIELFKSVEILANRNINNEFDPFNWELILQKSD